MHWEFTVRQKSAKSLVLTVTVIFAIFKFVIDRFIFNINLFTSDFWSIVLAGKGWPGALNKDPSLWQDQTKN
jgi:hypothetical protein